MSSPTPISAVIKRKIKTDFYRKKVASQIAKIGEV